MKEISKKESNDLAEARRVMLEESKALQIAAERLKEPFFKQTIDMLLKTNHKVVITGIGKSGHVGKKIAATFNSTGTPAAFLHPSEAVHGDLGIHQDGDVVIFLSNSGATPELLFLEPVLRSRNAKIIGILGNINSPLKEKVDVYLDGSISKEADNLGVVPTASYAVASSLGDAIASALMLRRGFGLDDYAETHPAGQLGRNLILKVEDVLHKPQNVACLSKGATMQETIIEMSKQPLGAACIIEDKKLLGIVTDGDLRRALNENDNLLKLNVTEVMSTNPLFIDPKSTLGQALELMEKRNPSPVSILPVIDPKNQNFLGILRLHDIYNG